MDFKFNISFGTSKEVKAEAEKRRSIQTKFLERQQFRGHEDIRTLENGIQSANNPGNYNREELHRLYVRITEEAHLASQWETRTLKTIEKEWRIVDAAGKEDKELMKLFEAEWMQTFMRLVLDSKIWGFSLIEFGIWKKGKFHSFKDEKKKIHDAVQIVNRDFVKPEFGTVVETTSELSGINYMADAWNKQLIFIGKTRDLGMALKAARPVLFKQNCLSNWSEWAEVFGMDVRIVKSDAQGDDRVNLLNTLKDLGTSGYGILDPDDEMDFKGVTHVDAYRVYERFIVYTDGNISKLMFGQDVITNNTGRVIGTTGENVANLYGDSDAKFVAAAINTELFPMMQRLGVATDGKTWKWDATEHIKLMDRVEMDFQISQMGFEHTEDYINDTYGTAVTFNPNLRNDPDRDPPDEAPQ